MPQIHQVLRCFECKTFQVQLIKKKPKWECKICHEKQSIKKIFLKSEDAKECRLMVQELNLHYSKLDDIAIECSNKQETDNQSEEEYHHVFSENITDNEISQANKTKSKWYAFLNKDCDSVNNVKCDSDRFSTSSLDCNNYIGNENNSTFYTKRQQLDDLDEETAFYMETKICNRSKLKINENVRNSHEYKYLGNNDMFKKERIFEDDITNFYLNI